MRLAMVLEFGASLTRPANLRGTRDRINLYSMAGRAPVTPSPRGEEAEAEGR